MFEKLSSAAEFGISTDTHTQIVLLGRRSILANRWGEDVLKYGDIIKQPVLAKTLRRLAEEGGEDMYSGSLAHSLVQDIQKLGETSCCGAKVNVMDSRLERDSYPPLRF